MLNQIRLFWFSVLLFLKPGRRQSVRLTAVSERPAGPSAGQRFSDFLNMERERRIPASMAGLLHFTSNKLPHQLALGFHNRN